MIDYPRKRVKAARTIFLSSVLAALLLAPLAALLAHGLWLGFDATTNNRVAGPSALRLWSYAGGSLAVALGTVLVALTSGVSSAFFLSRWELPAKKFLIVAAIMPLAVPPYLAAYVWVDSLIDWGVPGSLVRSLPTSWIVLGLSLSPYVLLPAWAAFLQTPRSLLESSRLLGLGRWAAFWQIELRYAAPAILGSGLLVVMEALADFGTVDHLAIDTWSSGIYRSWSAYADPGRAVLLALSLLIFIAALTAFIRRAQKHFSVVHSANASDQIPPRRISDTQQLLAHLVILTPPALLCLYPFGVLAHRWLVAPDGVVVTSRNVVALWAESLALSLVGATLITLTGILVVYLLQATPIKLCQKALRTGLLNYALPGSVLALGILLTLTPLGLGGSTAAVLLAYVIRYVTVTATPLESSWQRLPKSLLGQARVLGCSPAQALARVALPLLRPTLLGAFILGALDVIKELPATLMLRPFGMDTLAIHVYGLASDERLTEAAPAALALMLTGLTALGLALRFGSFGDLSLIQVSKTTPPEQDAQKEKQP